MKKCPYCHTLSEDNTNICPHCQRDISDILPMPEIAPKGFQFIYYMFFFGLLITVGGLIAGLSQMKNMEGFWTLYEQSTDQAKIESYYKLFKSAQFEMWAMYIVAGIGAILFITSIVLFIIKKTKKEK